MSDAVTRLNAALEGRYAIERKLGEGGMATVYLADDIKHNRKVALKVLKPELAAVVGAERFLAEIQVTANLQHPHILPLFDSGEADSFLFYVMPYVEGETLRDRIDREKQLPVDEAVGLASKVAGALQHAHENGVIHRDIKPGNILIQGGEPVVADFGIALAVGAAGGSRLTETGLSVGTPYYMSPEQATGDQALGPASDTYALACVLYEMLVGEAPYLGNTAQAVLGKIIAGKPVSATEHRPSIPANVDAALRCALEKLPADRFTSAQEFVRALGDEHFRHGEVEAGVGAAVSPWNRLTMAFAALAAVTTLGFGWSLLRPQQPRPVARFALTLAEGQELFTGGGVNFAVSPDGSRIVYVGASQLWQRRLNQLEPEPIPGTEGARNPVLSPDGGSVAFTSQGSLKTVSLLGGPPFTVVASGVPDGGGGIDWGTDGMLYFTDDAGAIQRVLASGGEPEPVTTPDAGTAHVWVDALSEGRGSLFTITRAGGPDQSEIAVVGLRNGEVRTLLPGAMARYASSGHIVYAAADNTLLAAPFDLGRLEVTGPSVGLLEGVDVFVGSASQFAVSETGTLLYTLAFVAAAPTPAPVWVERDGTVREIDPGWRTQGNEIYSSLALSPDNTRLAVSILDSEGTFDLWVKQLDAGPLSRLTFEGTQNFRATWSPNSQSLTFVSNRAEDYRLWTKRADGSGTAELVLDREADIWEGLYSSDGTWLVFRDGPLAAANIYAIRPGVDSVAVPLEVTEFQERSVSLSPNGRWLAYVSDRSGRDEVYVRPFPDAGASLQQVSADGGVEPVWAHSGRELFYRNGANELVAVQVTDDPTLAVGQQEVLFSMADYLTSNGNPMYDVSPDDQRFVMLRIGDVETAIAAPELIVVENWFEELKERVEN